MERKLEARVDELEGLFDKVLNECQVLHDGEASYQAFEVKVEEIAREALYK